MFETAELGQKVPKKRYQELVPALRERLLDAQREVREASLGVLVLFGGVDKAGKSETASRLAAWMDPRGVVTRAFVTPSDEERERPPYWRFWRAMPPKGRIGLLLSAWYSEPLLRRVNRRGSAAEFDRALDRILAFERTLADDGVLIQKFWMHLGRQSQKKRFQSLERDPLQRWRVTKKDWKHLSMYDRFIDAAEHLIRRTSTGQAPWTIVEGGDERYRNLRVAELLLQAIERRLAERRPGPAAGSEAPRVEAVLEAPEEGAATEAQTTTILDELDMTRHIEAASYRRELKRGQGKLNRLQRRAHSKGLSTIVVFEGWDAAGKGGAIRRATAALDAHNLEVIPIGAPTSEESEHHYLWRFWRHLPRVGRLTIFDRSWYGRVLVERVEGLASERQWRRAYAEIRDFEEQLVEHGAVLVKFWLHITRDEQQRRFDVREKTPHKRFKLTEEDWRNRARWDDYRIAVHDMVERTSTNIAPWTLVAANDKRHARVETLRTLCRRLEAKLEG